MAFHDKPVNPAGDMGGNCFKTSGTGEIFVKSGWL